MWVVFEIHYSITFKYGRALGTALGTALPRVMKYGEREERIKWIRIILAEMTADL